LVDDYLKNHSSFRIKKIFLNRTNFKENVGGIEFDDILASFLTYLIFVQHITPPTWQEYIYYPSQAIVYPKNELRWIGGILIPYIKKTTREERILCREAIVKIHSSFYMGHINNILYHSNLMSALAAIMARNMAHQQGSAVIPYLLSLSNEKERILSQYLSYLESRMDFVATAATMEFPKWGISVKFFKDLIVGFISQYGLIECLCKSEGYRYENIQFEVYINDDENLLEKDINTINDKDINVWIPGGFTGMQAFYLILENIMRNTAKYSEKGSKLIVRIGLKEQNDTYIIQVWDNLSYATDKVQDFNTKIREALIKPTGEKREGNWGFAEMRVCAAYLSNGDEHVAASELNENEICPIECVISSNNTIGYKFTLKKPQLLEIYWHENMNDKGLEKYGIRIHRLENIEEFKNNLPTSNFAVFAFRDDNEFDQFMEEIFENEYLLEKLPSRIFVGLQNSGESISLKNNTLLERRVCTLQSEDLKNIKSLLENKGKDPREAVVYLYCKWVEHLKLTCKENIKKILILKISEVANSLICSNVRKKYPIVDSLFPQNKEKKEKTNGMKIHLSEPLCGNNNYQIEISDRDWTNNNVKDSIIYCHHSSKTRMKNPYYYETFSGASFSFPMFLWWPDNEIDKQLKGMLMLENSLLQLVVADERICKNVKINWEECDIRKFYPVDVFKGDKEVVLREKGQFENRGRYKLKFEDNKWKFILQQDLQEKEVKLQNAILLIHQGVLDKGFKFTDKKNLEEKMKGLKELFLIIVVTSGRGKPPNVPENAKFMLLSDVLTGFREWKHPDKLALINIIMNLAGE
jgi:hypothetical protein